MPSKIFESIHLPEGIEAIATIGCDNLLAAISMSWLLLVFNCDCTWPLLNYFGDFHESEHNPKNQSCLSHQDCKNIIKNKTCFKSLEGSSINLILTSRPNLYQHTQVFESGMSDPHLMIYTMLKSTYTNNGNIKSFLKNPSSKT